MYIQAVFRAVLACCAIALLSACAGAAGETDVAAAPTCRTEAALGSAVARRSCHTPMSQEEIDPLSRDITLRNQQKPIGLGKPGS